MPWDSPVPSILPVVLKRNFTYHPKPTRLVNHAANQQENNMPLIYDVKIEPKEGNLFHITWNPASREAPIDFFNRIDQTLPPCWEKLEHQEVVGEALFDFLDGKDHLFRQALQQALKEEEPILQLNLSTCHKTADWPFELVTMDGEFLVLKKLYLVRRVSDRGILKKVIPQNRPLKILFMACSPLDTKPELDYEREEAEIIKATGGLPVDLGIEDSGSLEGLRFRLLHKEYDVVHLVGHADIDGEGRAYFCMENETGKCQKVDPGMLWDEAIIENPPRLLFLSACRTGETVENQDNQSALSFARLMVEERHVPSVLGWGRKVHDHQALYTGRAIFAALTGGKSIPESIRLAREELNKNFPHHPSPAWPLLRLYSNGTPLSPLVTSDRRSGETAPKAPASYLAGSHIKVLTEGFVGRRRLLQSILNAMGSDNDIVGVLLLGPAGLGKSCLAGKIGQRFLERNEKQKPGFIVLQGQLNDHTLETSLRVAFTHTNDKKGLEILDRQVDMKEKLADLCATSFKEGHYLLILDGFDMSLERGKDSTAGSLIPESEALLETLLYYLPFSGKMSHLIITSRHAFTLRQHFLAERLQEIWLTGFSETQKLKKLRELKNLNHYYSKESVLGRELLKIGCGNPRLMEELDRLAKKYTLVEKKGLLKAVRKAREDFIEKNGIRNAYQQCSESLKRLLGAMSLYRNPVLEREIPRVVELAEVKRWQEPLREGLLLGLLEFDAARKTYRTTPFLKDELKEKLKVRRLSPEEDFKHYGK